jgi:sugar lactone lactonase YvrE
VDLSGNLYIAEWGNYRIRKVAPGGTISTVAGTGTPGYFGDGGAATSARLNAPTGVAGDPSGNLYIADWGNYRIRKVTPGGTISTVAGNGTLYFGDGGPATSAQLDGPRGVTVDASGNLYIADNGNHRVRKVTPGGTISTVVGNGTAGYSGDGGPAASARLNLPAGLAVDSSGNLYTADEEDCRIRKVTLGGTISTVAGNGTTGYSGDGGPATSAQLSGLRGVAVDPAGNLYIADTYNNRIRKVAPGGTISTVAGNGTEGYAGDGGPATSAQLSTPFGVAVDSGGNLYIADYGNHRIRRVTPGGTISTVAGTGSGGYSGDGGPATSARLFLPSGVAADS